MQLFRALRSEELHSLLANGIKARCGDCPFERGVHDLLNDCCNISDAAHVQSGTKAEQKSRFISTTTNESVAAWYCCNSDGNPAFTRTGKSATYVELKVSPNSHDVIITSNQTHYGATARNRSMASNEVLVVDFIPSSCIMAVFRVKMIPKYIYDALQKYGGDYYNHRGRTYKTIHQKQEQQDKYMLVMHAWDSRYDIGFDIIQDSFADDFIPDDVHVEPVVLRKKQKRNGFPDDNEKDRFIGKRIQKQFDGKMYSGTVVKRGREYYKIHYDDGDQEEMDAEEVEQYLDQRSRKKTQRLFGGGALRRRRSVSRQKGKGKSRRRSRSATGQ